MAVDKTLGVAPLAYSAEIDFCHSSLLDTATSSNITVDFMAGNKTVGSQVIKGSVSDCALTSKGYLTAKTYTDKPVDSIRVTTEGGDRMLIDQVQAYRDGRKFIWDGRNNGGGWCLSTDANDYQGSWESAATRCSKSQKFSSPTRYTF